MRNIFMPYTLTCDQIALTIIYQQPSSVDVEGIVILFLTVVVILYAYFERYLKKKTSSKFAPNWKPAPDTTTPTALSAPFLAVIGRQWLESESETGRRRLDDPRDFVRIEIEAALQRDIPVIPLLVQGALVPDEEDLPPSLQSLIYRNAISIRPDPDFHRDVDRLINGIELHFKNVS